jgi:hypothetical protein
VSTLKKFVLVLLSGLLAACSSLPVSRTYVGSSAHGVSLSTPSGWRVFSAEEMLGRPEGGPPYLAGFGEASSDPADPIDSEGPGGVLLVTLHGSATEAVNAARNAYLLDLDKAVADGVAVILSERPAREEGGFEHREWLLEVRPKPDTVVRVIQRVSSSREPAGYDATGRPVYANKSLIIGCRTTCFETRQETIQQIISTWKVNL